MVCKAVESASQAHYTISYSTAIIQLIQTAACHCWTTQTTARHCRTDPRFCNPHTIFYSVMESRDLVSTRFLKSRSRRTRRSQVSVSKDFDLGLELFVSRLCIGYFLWSFPRGSLKKRFLKMIVQNLAFEEVSCQAFFFVMLFARCRKQFGHYPA